jgi:hypothetical protein
MKTIQIPRTSRIFNVHEYILAKFTKADWLRIGYLTDSLPMIGQDPRLLRSIDYGDEEYEGHSLEVLSRIVEEEPQHLDTIETYIQGKETPEEDLPNQMEFISTAATSPQNRIITFAPDVFRIPSTPVDPNKLSVMMPFEGRFNGTYTAIRAVCSRLGIDCKRADDIWNNSILIQDVFDLIFTSRAVITDFTDRNPNVFYETGVAHVLGKIVIPITQSVNDLANKEGLLTLEKNLEKKLMTVFK